MQQVALTALEWSRLPDVDDTEPLGQDDEACLNAVREVLVKFGKSKKFGISLLHSHFELSESETLVETIDEDRRILTTQVKQINEVGESSIPTSWKFTDQDIVEMLKCYKWCEPKTGTTGHTIMHDTRLW